MSISVSYAIIALLALLIATLLFLYIEEKRKNRRYKTCGEVRKACMHKMGHDIRTSLNAICGFSQILCDNQIRAMLSDKDVGDYGQIVQGNTDTLSVLVNGILDISDMDSGRYQMNIGMCNVTDVCRAALSNVKYHCPEGVRLHMTSDVPENLTMKSDPKRVEQVLMSFLSNAIKHTTDGDIVLNVSLSENPGNVTFSVTDTGTGVPPDQRGFLFRRIEELDTARGVRGIGLAICRIVAEQLHAKVAFDEDYVGPGARFLFIHPI